MDARDDEGKWAPSISNGPLGSVTVLQPRAQPLPAKPSLLEKRKVLLANTPCLPVRKTLTADDTSGPFTCGYE